MTTYFWLADVQYPGSKFILTVRDVDEWLESRRRHVEKNQQRAAEGAYDGKFLEVHLPAWEHEYRRHEGMVRSYFADRPDDLLVLDVTAGDGWEPLCEFLGLPYRSGRFPGRTGTSHGARGPSRRGRGGEMGAGDGERRFFFVKVMKTAGGTLLQQILANFEREQVYPYERYDPDMETANYNIEYLTRLSAERRDAISVFTGHFPFVAVEMLGMELTTITILRDPVERTLSYLRHCKRHHEQHRELALEEIYEDPFFYPCFIENHQAKQFAFTVEDRPQTYMDVLDVDSAPARAGEGEPRRGRRRGPAGAVRRPARGAARALRLDRGGGHGPQREPRRGRRASRSRSGAGSPPTTRPTWSSTSSPASCASSGVSSGVAT